MIAQAEQTSEVRMKFYNAAKQEFPNVGEPGTVWVLTHVLGWDWDAITRTSVEGFSREGYRMFILDSEGQRIWDHQGEYGFGDVAMVTRKWTKEEKAKLKDWWWLLGY